MGSVTIGGTSFDIYGEISTDTPGEPISATTYFLASLNAAAWTAADADTKAQALVTATRMLDKQNWEGEPTDTVTPQPLEWPRTGASDCNDIAVPSTDVPDGIVFGSYELASALLEDASVQSASSGGSNVRRSRDKVGDLETEREYFNSTSMKGSSQNAGRFPTAVQEFVSCFYGGSGIASVSITGAQESFFADRDYGYDGEGLP